MNGPLVTYTRGRDLSGSLEGAGGIGGLLARSHGYSSGTWSSHNFYHADGNGNVTALVNSSGALQASYKYDPYGRWLSGAGPLSSANLLRFSSKPWVAFYGSTTSGLYYYGYRFYDPYLQRWPNRDPFGSPSSQFNAKMFGSAVAAYYEEGIFDPELLPEGPNLYAFVGNDPINLIDSDGEAVPIIAIAVVVARGGFLAYRYYRSMAAAAAAARAGQSMIARNRATAQAIACRAGQGAPPIRHGPHPPGGRPEYLPHYHPNPNVTPPHTHIWWSQRPLQSYPRIPAGHPLNP